MAKKGYGEKKGFFKTEADVKAESAEKTEVEVESNEAEPKTETTNRKILVRDVNVLGQQIALAIANWCQATPDFGVTEKSKPEPEKKPEPKAEPAKKPEPKAEPAKKPEPKAEPAKKPEPKAEPKPAVVVADVPTTAIKNGPGKAYRYWDWKTRQFYLTQDIIRAVQASNGEWFVVWVWYENGAIHHLLDSEELKKYCP